MKSFVLIAALLAGAAQAQSRVDKETLCQAAGHLGQTIAERRLDGEKESDMLLALSQIKKPKTPGYDGINASRLIITYIFTMQLSPDGARKTIYLKCLVGDFGRL